MRGGEAGRASLSGGHERPASAPGASEIATRATVRNASLLVVQRGLDVFRGLAFAALVPRLLGPAEFGAFALLMSVARWFSRLSGLGSTQLMGRFVPVMLLRDEHEASRRLLGNLLAVRTLSGAAAGASYLLLTLLWLRDLPAVAVALVASGVPLRSVASVPFAFFLGLNQAARWGAGELVRRWSGLLLVVAGAWVAGLTGACLAMLVAEVLVLALGLLWVRPHLAAADVRLDRDFIGPYLEYNLVFFGSNMLFALSQHGGETLVRLTGMGYTEVGYFGVAAAAYVAATYGAWHVLMGFLPLLTRLRAEGRLDVAGQWASRLLKLLAALGVVACAGAWWLAPDVVPLLVGADFRPAARLVPVIAVAVLFHLSGSAGRLMALTLDRPRLALASATAQAATLAGLGLFLGRRYGAMGIAVATAAAAAVQAIVSLGGIRREARLRLLPALGVLGVGGLFVPLAFVPAQGLWARAGLFLLFLAGTAAVLRAVRLVTAEELAAIRRALRRSSAAPAAATA